MPILKTVTAPTLAEPTFHVVKRVLLLPQQGTIGVDLQGFLDADAFASGARPMWNTPLRLAMADIPVVTVAAIEAWIVAEVAAFAGGEVVEG